MRNQSGPSANVRLKPSDLRIKHQCSTCGHWHVAHAVPWGEPVAMLVTGYCGQCGATYLSLRGVDGDAGGAALQLCGTLLQGFPGVEVEGGRLVRR